MIRDTLLDNHVVPFSICIRNRSTSSVGSPLLLFFYFYISRISLSFAVLSVVYQSLPTHHLRRYDGV